MKRAALFTYAGLAEDVVPGNRILIDDGLIELEVKEVAEGTHCLPRGKRRCNWARKRV